MHGFFLGLLGLALVVTMIFIIIEKIMIKMDSIHAWKTSKSPVKKKQKSVEKKRQAEVKVIRKSGKTVFSKGSSAGVMALHDNGKITVNMPFKPLLHGFEYRRYGDYYSMSNPTTKEKQIIMDRLFG